MESSTKMYRFKVNSAELYEEMINFSKIHCFENKTTLKESFNTWYENPQINNLIQNEEIILKRNDYNLEKTNIKTKIFKSIKYYHIKNINKNLEKNITNNNDIKLNVDNKNKKENENENEKRKNFVFSKYFIENTKKYLNQNINNTDFKPSIYFEKYMIENKEEIDKEKLNIQENRITMNREMNRENNSFDGEIELKFDEEIDLKIKKMFKNQYFSMFKSKNV